jgi:hypothetical protein
MLVSMKEREREIEKEREGGTNKRERQRKRKDSWDNCHVHRTSQCERPFPVH